MIPRAALAPDCRFLSLMLDSLRVFSWEELEAEWAKAGMAKWERDFWLRHPAVYAAIR